MEILDLMPPDFGIKIAGIYVMDDDGLLPIAGPFTSEATAIDWIVQRQMQFTCEQPPAGGAGLHPHSGSA